MGLRQDPLELTKEELFLVVECGAQIIIRAYKFGMMGHATLKGHLEYCHGSNFTDDFLHWATGNDSKEDVVRDFFTRNPELIKKLMNYTNWIRYED